MAIKKGNERREMPRNRILRRLFKLGKGETVETRNGGTRPINTDKFIPRFGDDDNEHDDDAVLMQAIIDVFGDAKPKVLRNVYLLDVDFDDDTDTEVTYQLDYEHWGKGFLVKRCDGVTINKMYSDKLSQAGKPKHVFAEAYIGTEFEQHFNCQNDGSYKVQDSGKHRGSLSCGCSFKARLRLVSEELIKVVDTVYGYIEVESGSRADDISIIACLRDIKSRFAEPRGLLMTQIPLKVYRESMPNYAHGGFKHVIRVSVDYVAFEKIAADNPVLPVVNKIIVSDDESDASQVEGVDFAALSRLKDNALDFNDAQDDEPELYADVIPDDAFDDNTVPPTFEDMLSDVEGELLYRLDNLTVEYLDTELIEVLDALETTGAEFAAMYQDMPAAKFAVLKLATELGLRFQVNDFVAERKRGNWSTYTFNVGLTHVKTNSRADIVAPLVAMGADEKTLKAAIKKTGIQSLTDTLGVDCLYVSLKSKTNDDNTVTFDIDKFHLDRED